MRRVVEKCKPRLSPLQSIIDYPSGITQKDWITVLESALRSDELQRERSFTFFHGSRFFFALFLFAQTHTTKT